MSTEPSRLTVFALVAVGVFMATLDTSIVNVSLPAIARHFEIAAGPLLGWVVLAYLVVVAALLLTVGRLADLIGHRTVWTLGLVVFSAGSALCGAAPSLAFLVFARALQGIGGALLMAIGPALLLTAFPREQRGRAIGLNAIVVGVGVSSGPVLGGLLTERFGFRAIFYVNVPVGLIGALVAWLRLPRRPRTTPVHFDAIGALLLAAAFGALTAAVSLGGELGLRAPLTLSLWAVFAIALPWLVWHERRHPHPIVDLGLFRDRVFATASVSLVLSFLASFALAMLLPLYFQQLRGLDLEHTGLLLTPLPLTTALLSPLTGSLSDRTGTRVLASTGMVLLAGALALLSTLAADTPLWVAVLGLLLAGLGQAIFRAPNNSALMGAAPPNRQGVASGLLATARVVGQSLSIALAGAVFGGHGSAEAGRALVADAALGAPRDPLLAARFVEGFRAALWVLAGVALLAALTSSMRRPSIPGGHAGKPRRP